jgi:hypothetical protein
MWTQKKDQEYTPGIYKTNEQEQSRKDKKVFQNYETTSAKPSSF